MYLTPLLWTVRLMPVTGFILHILRPTTTGSTVSSPKLLELRHCLALRLRPLNP